MGLLSTIQGDRIYLDTNVWIYAVESYPAFIQELSDFFQRVDRSQYVAITSELSLAETLIKPIKDNNRGRQAAYKKAIVNRNNVSVVPILREILINAAQVRAEMGLKLPDAIHAATAVQAQCSTFVTNDAQLKKLSNLHVVLLSEVIP
jgi:predicted nucleic acid-binding protein